MRWSLALFLVVPILNIALNTWAQKTAKQVGSFGEQILSSTFLITMAIGTSSVLSMIVLYRSGIALPRAILLMGAISILGGTLWGIYYAKVQPTFWEWALFACIALLLFVRFRQLSS